MAATPAQDLFAEANCYACYGASATDLLDLVLDDRISQLASVESFADRAGITDPTQIEALDNLVIAARAHGWWQKCDLIYPFVGGTALAHSQNLKSSSFTITWSGTVTHDANGITGNGTTGYGSTGYIPSSAAIMTLNSAHIGIYRRTTGSNSRHYVSGNDVTNALQISKAFGTSVSTSLNGAATLSLAAPALRFISSARLDAAAIHIYEAIDNSGASASAARTAIELFVLARNNNGATASFSDANLAGVTVGSGITFAEYQVMAADWQAFQTTLGRQV